MHGTRVLVVDDQVYFRVFLEEALGAEDYEVETVGSGEEALARLGERDFDLVLTDLVMPGMDGHELVQRVREQCPGTDVVVVTSVGSVDSAVEAMRGGATDYLVKPVDRAALIRAMDAIVERRMMRDEHERLMAENLEFMGAFTLYERALGLFANLSPESLADRIVEVLCLEANAHGGVLWLDSVEQPGRLRLAGVRGLVRVENEAEEIDLQALPEHLLRLGDEGARSFLQTPPEAGDDARAALYVPLRHAGRVLGVVRLTDRLDGREFSAADRDLADRFLPYGGQAVANAMRVRALERRSFREPTTGAYNQAYFEDVTRNEIRKASRFGRPFSLLRVVLDQAPTLRARLAAGEYAIWQKRVAEHVSRAARGTDLVAFEGDGQFCLLLPETEPLGATVLKRRIRSALERCAELRELAAEDRPTPFLATASFPGDGVEVAALDEALTQRIEEDRQSLVRGLDLEASPFRGLVDALLAEAKPGRVETTEQVGKLLVAEVARRPHERGMLFVAPGPEAEPGLREALERLRGADTRTDVVMLANGIDDTAPGLPVTWVSPLRSGTEAPFVVYYGEGPPYALVRDAAADGGETAFFHTDDPVLVEQLAFQLGRDLGIPIGD